MPDVRQSTLAALTAILIGGTLYSVAFNTFLDTSDPLLTSLPHPQHALSYFARKQNILNQLFIKKSWGWTTAAFIALWTTSPREARTRGRFYKWVVATTVWLLFTTWFFGPAVGERVTALSGGQCVVRMPSGILVPVPSSYCVTREALSPATHPDIFPVAVVVPDGDWRTRPKLVRGHDISGHVFLLTMSSLFLADQLHATIALPNPTTIHSFAILTVCGLVSLWMFATYTTSVYFHTPIEKLTGYLVGVAGFLCTQLPFLQDPTPVEMNVEAGRRD
ncbi:hypothetical protein BD410DRAFT_209148 [Rickenella mellea]|uniref:FIT family protein scs3 n=1 Tax=Rickenella mellea TaxID=50990 RepID=A0A4Y7Q615_9AGAM|nr:hypothetical protein BD410DRAFT_209148 [Rickenella mellea]